MTEPGTSKRLFIGIPVPDTVSEAIRDWRDAHFHRKESGVRWVPPENWHITLCFIGKTDRSLSDDIMPRVNDAMTGIGPFDLAFDRFQYFPPKKPRMIWGRYASTQTFVTLYDRLNWAFYEPHELKQEAIPHITLARLKKGKAPDPKPEPEPTLRDRLHFTAERVVLWASVLGHKGPVYHPLEERGLNKD